MTTLLLLVQDLARQSGTLAGGVTITTVSGVTGRADKLVNWINSAWEDIQNQRQWNWLRDDFSHALTIGTARYGDTSLALTRWASWVEDTPYQRVMTIYDPAIGVSDEGEISQISYAQWKGRYGRGAQETNRPRVWAISPAGELCVGPAPDKAYVLQGEFWKSPQALTVDADEPELPARFHKAIVYRAMMLLAEGDESIPTLQLAEREYQRIFASMCMACLPMLNVSGEALA